MAQHNEVLKIKLGNYPRFQNIYTLTCYASGSSANLAFILGKMEKSGIEIAKIWWVMLN